MLKHHDSDSYDFGGDEAGLDTSEIYAATKNRTGCPVRLYWLGGAFLVELDKMAAAQGACCNDETSIGKMPGRTKND